MPPLRADRSLASLSSTFRPKAEAWIAACIERGVLVRIVQTIRTPQEGADNLANGTSATALSLHLPRRLRPSTLGGYLGRQDDLDKGDAMDLAPLSRTSLVGTPTINWNASHPDWGVIMACAEAVGLRSGGRWRTPFDPGHGECVFPPIVDRLAIEQARPWPVAYAAVDPTRLA